MAFKSQQIFFALRYRTLESALKQDHLRRDPVHGLICGKRDPLGQDRLLERDKGKALAAHSTLNRLELSAQSIDLRYHKIQVQPDEVEDLLIKRAVKAIPHKSAEIVLDFDTTDDPLHRSQEGGYFNGYYRHYCYLPLYCFCGNIPFLAKLGDCAVTPLFHPPTILQSLPAPTRIGLEDPLNRFTVEEPFHFLQPGVTPVAAPASTLVDVAGAQLTFPGPTPLRALD